MNLFIYFFKIILNRWNSDREVERVNYQYAWERFSCCITCWTRALPFSARSPLFSICRMCL